MEYFRGVTKQQHSTMVIITNKGLIDPLAFELIGASTKRNDNSTIGFFGSGMKYAIAGLLRRGIPFQVWRGEQCIEFSVEEVTMRDNTFSRILIDGRHTSLTTDMGPKWETWMLVRELYANARDEGGEMAVTPDYQQFIRPDHTTIIFPDPEPIQEVISRQDFFFTRDRDVVYQDARLKVYGDIGDGAYYVKGIMVGHARPGHGYEVLDESFDINEERVVNFAWKAKSAIFERIMAINDPRVVRRIVAKAKLEGTFEAQIFSNTSPYTFSSVEVSEAWKAVMFFPVKDGKFASEWNHVVVSDEIYSRLSGANKFTRRKWDPSGTNEQNAKLLEAVELVRREAPEVCGNHEFAFGKSASSKLGMGIQDGVYYVSDTIAGDSVPTIAAHLILMLSDNSPGIGLKCLERYFTK